MLWWWLGGGGGGGGGGPVTPRTPPGSGHGECLAHPVDQEIVIGHCSLIFSARAGGEAKKNTNKTKQTWDKTQGGAGCCQPECMDWSYFTFAGFTEFYRGSL